MLRAHPWAWLLAALAPMAAFAAGVEDQDLSGAVRQLDTGSWSARIRTVHELEYMEEAGIPALALAAVDGDWQVRMAAVHALGPLGPKATPILRYILKHEPCPVVRLITLHDLGSLAADGEEEKAIGWMFSATSAQVNACRDQPAPGRAAWAGGIARLASRSSPSAPAPGVNPPPAAARREDPSQESHEIVVTADVPKKTRAAPDASAPASAPTKNERYAELDSLLSGPSGTPETLGGAPALPVRPPSASAAVPRTSTATRPVDRAALSTRRTLPPETLPRPVVTTAAQEEPESAPASFEAAGSKAPHDAMPELLLTLKKGNAGARARAADVLGSFGAEAASAVPALMAALKDKSPRVRASAGLALGNIGADDSGVVPLLVKALKDKNPDVRYAATLALSRIGTQSARAAFQEGLGEDARRAIEGGR